MINSLKQHAKNALAFILSLGSSLTLGLLSFGGFYALIPSLTIGFSSFILASLYEGQIYFENIKAALQILFEPKHFDELLAEELIEEVLQNESDEKQPQFFTDYQQAKKRLSELNEYHNLSPQQQEKLKNTEKDLSLMKQYFYQAITDKLDNKQKYAQELNEYTKLLNKDCAIDKAISNASHKQTLIKYGFIASALASSIFTLGSVYLILEMLATLSFIVMPFPAIITLATICGIASAALTANSLADMIWKETLSKWLNETIEAYSDKNDQSKSWTLTLGSILLVSLSAFLTVCTWGTWWTITDEIKKIPNIIKRIPIFITKTVLPTISAAAAFIFTIENTKESLDLILDACSNNTDRLKKFFNKKIDSIKNFFEYTSSKEVPLYQLLNPFNFLIYLIEAPLKAICFLAHILSVSVTANRIPYVPMWLSMLGAFLSEFLEDLHYFAPGDAEKNSGHTHHEDIPSQFIHALVSPLYWLGWAWHSKGSQWFSRPTNFYNFWQSTTHQSEDENVSDVNEITPNEPSIQWQQQRTLMQLKGKIDNLEAAEAQEKRNHLKSMHDAIAQELTPNSNIPENSEVVKTQYKKILNNSDPKLSEHRSFWHLPGQTDTESLLGSLQKSLAPIVDTTMTATTL